MKVLRRFLILSHRYLGIALSAMAVIWFATGFVMMYAGGMPRLTQELRLERAPDLDLSRVRLRPSEAAERLRDTGALLPGDDPRAELLTVMDRPAYRLAGETVFADSGELLDPLDSDQAKTVASRFMRLPEERLRLLGTSSGDQWTLGLGSRATLHKFSVDDPEGTEIYVDSQNAEISNLTTRRGRMLAWMGTIPHWLYFEALRANQPLWYRLVVWSSAAVCVLAVLGLLLGVTQFKRTRPFRLATAIPYSGWMRWHYVTGVVFGVFTLTWAFSGLLSMEPFEWTNARGLEVERDVLTGGPVDLSRFTALGPATWNGILGGRAIKRIAFARIQDGHYYVVRQSPDGQGVDQRRERLHQPYPVTGRREPHRVLVDAESMEVRHKRFSTDSLVARLRAALPEVPIVESALLTEYDSYYYSRGRQTPLPVVRVKFDDPAETWVYIDPEMSQVLAEIPRLSRVERWLYNGLHSLDFAFWYDRRPLWDVAMIVLLAGGLTSSVLGMVMGFRRLRRGAHKATRWAGSTASGAAPQPDQARRASL
jgi:uncharacterized iron-regulated membrane protein